MAITPLLRTALGESGVLGKLNQVTQGVPMKSGSGPKNWANANATRGHSATGRKVAGKYETTYGSKTKLASLKRGR